MSDTRQDVRIAGIGWRPILHVMVGVAALMIALVTIKQLTSLLQMLLVSVFLAIAADAAARSVQRMGMSRAWSLVTVILGSILGGILVVLLLLPPLIKQAAELVASAPEIAASIENSDVWQSYASDFQLSDSMIDAMKNALLKIPEVAANVLAGLIGGIFDLVTIIIAVAFLLAGGAQALRLLLRLVPPLSTAQGWVVVVGAYTNIGKYVVGATLQAICAGVSLALVLLLLGVPNALALGVFMLIMDYIPLVGATIGAVPAVAVALFANGWGDGVLVCLFVVIYQQIENTIIQPRIQGKVVHLPGIAIFFSVMVGGQLLGILGALIAVPVASICQIVLNQYFDFVGRPVIELPNIFDEKGRPILAGAVPVAAAPDEPPAST